MPSRTTRSTVGIAFLVGLLVGAAVVPTLGAVSDAFVTGDDGPDPTPPYSYSYAGGPCVGDATANENAGWVHAVAAGETYTVTLNATVVRPPGTDIEANVSRRPSGAYELALRTVPAEETETESPKGDRECPTLSRVGVGTALDSPRFVVTMNGREVLSVDWETTANLYPLPNPLNATG